MPALQKRDTEIHIIEGEELVKEMTRIAESQGIDLSLADLDKTKETLKSLRTPLSDEIVRTREDSD